MRRIAIVVCLGFSLTWAAQAESKKEEADALKACAEVVIKGFKKIANSRDLRFNGKVDEARALCRGGQRALQFRNTPWVDWSNLTIGVAGVWNRCLRAF